MLNEQTYVTGQAHKLLDFIKVQFHIHTDTELAARLGIVSSIVSNLRHRKIKASPFIILKIHETFDIRVKDIRKLLEEE